MSTLHEKYNKEVVPALKKQFNYKNLYQVPRIDKVVLNTCLKEAIQDIKVLDTAVEEMALIAGQRPVVKRARKSISNFKLRQGMPIGCSVTLRKERMFEFLNRLIHLALPRIRDFRGVSGRSFDGRGNYTLGLAEQIIFPEIDFNKVTKVYGLNISVVTTATTDQECKELLKLLGMPFRN